MSPDFLDGYKARSYAESRRDPDDPATERPAGDDDVWVAGADAGRGSRPELDGVYMQRFTIDYDYPVCFTCDLFATSNPLLAETLARKESRRRHRCLVLIDDGLAQSRAELPRRIMAYANHRAETMQLLAPPEFVPGGERCKNDPGLVAGLQRKLMESGLDRHSFVIAIGGGAVLDLVGYVAATTHRGIRLVRVPTTVLAQNDSGVGVKNGVNGFGVKNLLGSFAPPFAVLNDSGFLDELDPREKRAGMAEAVKVALIRDEAFFHWLEASAAELRAFRPEPIAHLIRRCAELHMIQIAMGGDPFEHGSARPLDYGHWSAHKLESLTGHELRHGEAVAIGIALDARYSVLGGWLAEGQDRRIRALLRAFGLPVWHPMLHASDSSGELAVLKGLGEFREHLGGELTITLLAAIGRGIEVHEMDEALILEAIEWLKEGADE